jgi:hypothetical protein
MVGFSGIFVEVLKREKHTNIRTVILNIFFMKISFPYNTFDEYNTFARPEGVR